MKKLIQTKLKTETKRGNCLATVLACLLNLNSVEEAIQIQEYYDREDVLWIEILDDWLESKGYEREYILEHLYNDEFYMVSGNTIRNNSHVCIYQNGKLYHDPHPDQTGLITENHISILRKLQQKVV